MPVTTESTEQAHPHIKSKPSTNITTQTLGLFSYRVTSAVYCKAIELYAYKHTWSQPIGVSEQILYEVKAPRTITRPRNFLTRYQHDTPTYHPPHLRDHDLLPSVNDTDQSPQHPVLTCHPTQPYQHVLSMPRLRLVWLLLPCLPLRIPQ